MATVTPIASVRTILDAADDAAASSGVLALLEDQDVEVASIELPRTGGLVKPADTLTLDAAGRLVVNDNDRAGGRRVSDDRRYCGRLQFNSAATAAVIYNNFVTIPLTAAECAVNATYQIIGKWRATQTGGTKIGFALGLLDSATNVANAGFPNPIGIYGTEVYDTDLIVEAEIDVTLKNVAGVLSVLAYPLSGVEFRKVYSGSGVVVSTLNFSDPAAAFPSSAQNIYLHVASFGGGSTELRIDYDLQLIVTKP